MADISAAMVKELRDRTGQAMMDCKKALIEVGGDMEKAVDILRKKGMAVMEKRGGRFRAQLLTQAPGRAELHRFLRLWVREIEGSKESRRVRWSLDVDPADLF